MLHMSLYVYLMSVNILFMPMCTCIIKATSKVVTMSSVQLSAVVLPPMLLQMVNEMALVQP